MIPWANLKRQYDNIKDEIDKGVLDVLDSGWYIMGKNVENFEKELASYHSAKHAHGVNSGTDALQLALMAIGVKSGDEVITVPNVSAPTVCAIISANATPVLVDIDPDTYNMDPAAFEKAVTPKTKAVIPVHIYGQACDMDSILSIAKKNGIKVIEDNAQAIGTHYKGKMTGTLGDIGCISFYPTKNLGAYGDGGAVVTDNPELSKKISMLRSYGETTKYDNKIFGINSRLDEIQARILSIKLKHLNDWIKRRQEIAKMYEEGLKGENIVLPKETEDSTHTYHVYSILVDDRDNFRKKLQDLGVSTSIHYETPIHFQDAFKDLGNKGDFPVTEKTCKRLVSLPMFPELTNEEVATVIEKVKEVLSS